MSGTKADCDQASLAIGESASTAGAAASAAAAAALPASAPSVRPSRKRPRDDDQGANKSAAQTCFTDGLHSIFSFLNLREFAFASRCCRSWRGAASSQPPFHLSREASSNQLEAIADSHMARHIDQIGLSQSYSRGVAPVLSLCCRLPHLTRLLLRVLVDDPDESQLQKTWGEADDVDQTTMQMQMPHTLRELEVSVYSDRSQRLEWSVIDSLLVRFCHSATPPLTSLRIEVNTKWGVDLATQIPVETLSRIIVLKDSLTELTLDYQGPHFESEPQEHIDVFRQLTRLEKLDPFHGCWSDEELMMLCAEPAPKRLRLLPLHTPPRTQAGGEALARLPLTDVDFRHDHEGHVDTLSFLRRIPTLQSIRIGGLLLRDSPADMESLVTILAGCTRCTSLTTPPWMTNDHLCRFLPSLTNLRVLCVQAPYQSFGHIRFGGLSFASSSPHLARTLERLELTTHQPMPMSELHHLHSLRNLRLLDLWLQAPTPKVDLDQAKGEFNTDRPETFRRDRWPHMVRSWLGFFL